VTAIPSIDTERLTLRAWRAGDFAIFERYYDDPDDARYVGGRKDREQAWRHLALQLGHWALKGFGYWAVDEKASGAFVGCAGLWQSPGFPEMELGYWLLRDHRGKGYALEACLRCRQHAREALRAPSLVSYIHPDNTASRRLAERLGAVHEQTIELATFGPHCVYRHF
jgi:RimJ/RimL family protein N-acetyltransferase